MFEFIVAGRLLKTRLHSVVESRAHIDLEEPQIGQVVFTSLYKKKTGHIFNKHIFSKSQVSRLITLNGHIHRIQTHHIGSYMLPNT